MAKKANQWNFDDVAESPLVKQTEENVTNGFQQLSQTSERVGEPAVSQQQEPKRRKEEPTQNMLIKCPVSLHARLSRLKADTFEQTGERINLNDMAVQAIAFWLDAQK